MKVKDVDKTLVASVALHVLVLGWAMVSVSTKALEIPPEDSVAVDVISSDQLAKVMAGMKTGKKENPKPLVEKVLACALPRRFMYRSSPCMLLVPDFVTMFSAGPAVHPYSDEKAFDSTVTS